jgi:anti-anti-sigma factor
MVYRIEQLFPGIFILVFTGRLDMQGIEALLPQLEALLKQTGQMVIIDLSEVKALPSPGIRLLLRIVRMVKEAGGKAAAAAPVPQVEYALCVSGLDTEMAIYHSVEKAMTALKNK